MQNPSKAIFPLAKKRYKNESMPILFYFSASWCSHCVAQKPLVEKLAVTHKNDFKVISIDLDNDSDFAIAAGVQTIPSLVFVNSSKTRGGIILGRQNKSQLNAFIKEALTL